MESAAHGHSTLGIPKNVGEEFVSKDEGQKPQAAGVVFIAPDGEVLLLRRAGTEKNYANHWSLPGGKADDGEDAETCADRECREEIGFMPEGAKRLVDRRDTPNGMVFSTFAQEVDEKFQPKLNGEHSGYAWFSLDALPEPIHPAVKEVLGSMEKRVDDDEFSLDGWTESDHPRGEGGQFGAEGGGAKKPDAGPVAVPLKETPKFVTTFANEFNTGAKRDAKIKSVGSDTLKKALEKLEGHIDPSSKDFRDRAEAELKARGHANDEAHETDSVGRVHLQRVPISKACCSPYKGSEIPNWEQLGLSRDVIYKLFRDPEELAKGASTFNGIQLLQIHTPVTAEDHKPYDIVGTTGTNAEFEYPFLYNDLSVWTQTAINALEDESKRELSCSYSYDADMTHGTHEGEDFQGVMRNIKGNHVATVSKGRVGAECAIDEDPFTKPTVKQEIPMTKKAAPMSRTAVRLRTALSVLAMDENVKLDGIVKGVTAKNFTARKPAIAKAARLAFDDLGASATGATPDDVIMRVLDLVEGETAAEPAEMDEMAMADPNAAPPPAAVAPPEEEDDELDENGQPIKKKPAGMDKAMVMDWLKSKGMGEDDISELDGMMGEADDEEAPEMKPIMDKKARDKAMDKKARDGMVTKEAMDQALASVTETVMKTQRGIAQATEFVRPWIGSLAMDASITCESDIYRKTLSALGVSGAATLHIDALKPVLEAQPKPNARRPTVAFANDAARADSADARFPHMAQRAGA